MDVKALSKFVLDLQFPRTYNFVYLLFHSAPNELHLTLRVLKQNLEFYYAELVELRSIPDIFDSHLTSVFELIVSCTEYRNKCKSDCKIWCSDDLESPTVVFTNRRTVSVKGGFPPRNCLKIHVALIAIIELLFCAYINIIAACCCGV